MIRKKLKSTSKVNLGLWIKNKRDDGYHELDTIFFENENLYDEVEIIFTEAEQNEISVNFTDNSLNLLINEKDNIAYKAVNLFFSRTGIHGKCNIIINKYIPMEAGLGGGSSNAACVLKGLNEIFKTNVETLHATSLHQIAQGIGSDVPFFLYGGTCHANGRGEILCPVENNLSLEIKIIKDENISVSTKWAYEQFKNRGFKSRHTEIKNLLKAMKEQDYNLFFENLFNDFENIVFEKYPKLLEIRSSLLKDGYVPLLCGSGSALCGIKRRV